MQYKVTHTHTAGLQSLEMPGELSWSDRWTAGKEEMAW